MIKLLIGGSPCTKWSIAQTRTQKSRETRPQGIGWELFKNYLIARDKFMPDYFLYENNKSMATAIQEQITNELGVEPILINSERLSAQSRKRLYWAGKRNNDGSYSTVQISEPQDKGLLLHDIVLDESEVPVSYWYDKPLEFTGRESGVVANIIAPWLDIMRRVYSLDSKSPTLHTCGAGNLQAKVMQNGRARKLTVREYARLQTVPEEYIFPVISI